MLLVYIVKTVLILSLTMHAHVCVFSPYVCTRMCICGSYLWAIIHYACKWVRSTCIGEICNGLWHEACGLLLAVLVFWAEASILGRSCCPLHTEGKQQMPAICILPFSEPQLLGTLLRWNAYVDHCLCFPH